MKRRWRRKKYAEFKSYIGILTLLDTIKLSKLNCQSGMVQMEQLILFGDEVVMF